MSEAIGYAAHEDVGYLKLAGELRHDTAAPLDALIERLFAPDELSIKAVVIDLTEVTFMDSTVIGLLASIARALLSRSLPAPTLFSTNPEINQLLTSLCLDQVFTIVDAPTDRPLGAVQVHAVRGECAERQCSSATILKAHEVLIEMNESNRDAFQSVVDLFRDEVGR